MIAYIWVNFNRNKSLTDKYLLILAEKRLTYHAVFAKFITGTAVNRRSFMQYIEIFKKAILLMRRLAALTLAAFMTFLSVLTLGIDAFSAGKRHPEVSKVNVLLIGAAERSQGITTDGKYYYFSSKWGLTKSELDGKTRVKSNPLAIPQQLKDDYGLAHIGGISYSKADNCIYAGLEEQGLEISSCRGIRRGHAEIHRQILYSRQHPSHARTAVGRGRQRQWAAHRPRPFKERKRADFL